MGMFKKLLVRLGLVKKHYWGACYCGNEGQYFNIGRNHWICCDNCKTKWNIGSNLFSNWHYEDEKLWRKNAENHKDFKEIEPIYYSFSWLSWKTEKVELCGTKGDEVVPF